MKNKYEYENYIKRILENTYCERYSNLLKAESPDFHNQIVGMEITTVSNKPGIEFDFDTRWNDFKKDHC